jgi:NAD(P)-dependent dehydrogenase (short-subunit alcohol dehydrogenase family)
LDLAGRTVVITGGARGIGFDVACLCASRGANVAILDRDGADAAAVCLGGGVRGFTVDVTDLEALERTMAQIDGVDVLVANAGIGPVATLADAGDREHLRRVLDVNLYGVWNTVWAAAPHLDGRRGHLVIVSSIAAFTATPTWGAYSVSKAGVEMLSRVLRIELAGTGTSVGVAHFGLVETGLISAFEADPLTAEIEARLPGWIVSKVSSVAAAEALVRGIERRAPRTIYPYRWRVMYVLRGVLGPVSDAAMARMATGPVERVRARDRLARSHA